MCIREEDLRNLSNSTILQKNIINKKQNQQKTQIESQEQNQQEAESTEDKSEQNTGETFHI